MRFEEGLVDHRDLVVAVTTPAAENSGGTVPWCLDETAALRGRNLI